MSGCEVQTPVRAQIGTHACVLQVSAHNEYEFESLQRIKWRKEETSVKRSLSVRMRGALFCRFHRTSDQIESVLGLGEQHMPGHILEGL